MLTVFWKIFLVSFWQQRCISHHIWLPRLHQLYEPYHLCCPPAYFEGLRFRRASRFFNFETKAQKSKCWCFWLQIYETMQSMKSIDGLKTDKKIPIKRHSKNKLSSNKHWSAFLAIRSALYWCMVCKRAIILRICSLQRDLTKRNLKVPEQYDLADKKTVLSFHDSKLKYRKQLDSNQYRLSSDQSQLKTFDYRQNSWNSRIVQQHKWNVNFEKLRDIETLECLPTATSTRRTEDRWPPGGRGVAPYGSAWSACCRYRSPSCGNLGSDNHIVKALQRHTRSSVACCKFEICIE